MQSLKGSAIDLIDVDPKAVDFREMCEQLAGLNRHCGAAQQPVSVAVHTLIALDCAEDAIKPWVALKEFAAARIGDIPIPTRQALRELAGHLGGQYAEAVRFALGELERRHEVAIHLAAGLPLPIASQVERVRQVSLRAFATERRDFMSETAVRWSVQVGHAKPSTKVYTRHSFGKCAFDVGESLYKRLATLLPTLSQQVALPAAVRTV